VSERETQTGQELPVVNPATGELVTTVTAVSADGVVAAGERA
jgi:hypothetical protein